MAEIDEINTVTPKEYFTNVKNSINTLTDTDLKTTFNCCLDLLDNYKKTGQIVAMKKLMFQLDCIEKEEQLLHLGINTFIYKEDVENFIDNVSRNVVKIIELRNYERVIPNDIVDIVEKTKNIFNEFYVVFTDYTGKVERQVEKKRREKDPILLGTFQDTTNNIMLNKMYFIGDWIDDYCDLTLSKMVELTRNKIDKNIANNISTEEHIKELKDFIATNEANIRHTRTAPMVNKSTNSTYNNIFTKFIKSVKELFKS